MAERAEDPERWEPVLQAIARDPKGPLAEGLSTPWRLAVAVYDERDLATGEFVRDPGELVDLADWTGADRVRGHLVGLMVPAAVAACPVPGGADAARACRRPATLAGYLGRNVATGRGLGGRVLSGTGVVLHELWPVAGFRLPRVLTAVFVATTAFPILEAFGLWRAVSSPGEAATWLVGVVTAGLYVSPVWPGWANVWPEPGKVDLRRLRTPEGRRGVELGLGLGLWIVGVVMILVGSEAESEAGFQVLVTGIGFGVVVGLMIGFLTGLTSSDVAGVGDARNVPSADLTFLIVVGLLTMLLLGFMVGLKVGFVFGLVVGPVFTFGDGRVVPRCPALPACTRRWNKVWLPWRLGRFLDRAYRAGLLRVSGVAYRFRRRKLQDYLARHAVPRQ